MDDKTFYGPKQVEFVTDLDDKFCEIQFVGGGKEVVTKKTFALSITQEQKDYNYLQEVKFKAMMEEVMKVVLDYDIQMYEADAFISAIVKNIKERYSRAINYLWTKDDRKYIQGSDPTDFFTVAQAEEIINKIGSNESESDAKAE